MLICAALPCGAVTHNDAGVYNDPNQDVVLADGTSWRYDPANPQLPAAVNQVMVQRPFNTPIVRVTSPVSDNGGFSVYQYSALYDTFNTDSTHIMYNGDNGGNMMADFDPVNLSVSNKRVVPDAPCPTAKLYWSHLSPDKYYAVTQCGIYKGSASSGGYTLIFDFAAADPRFDTTLGVDSRGMSSDDNRFHVNGNLTGIGPEVMVADVAAQKFVFQSTAPKLKGDLSKDGVWFMSSNSTVYNIETGEQTLMDSYGQDVNFPDVHYDWGHGWWACFAMHQTDGNYRVGYRFMPNKSRGWTGAPEVALAPAPKQWVDLSGHSSMRVRSEDEFIASWSTTLSSQVPVVEYAQEITGFPIAGSPDGTVNIRIAHHYSRGWRGYTYQTFGNQSQDGCFVAFNSDRGTDDTNSLYIAKICDTYPSTKPLTPQAPPLPPRIDPLHLSIEVNSEGGWPDPLTSLHPGSWLLMIANDLNTSWSISPAVGTINSAGRYTPPPALTSPVRVTVTGTGLYGAVGTFDIDVLPAGNVVSVSVSPNASTLSASQSQQFAATVTGAGNTAVTWTVSPQVGQISSGGVYTAPASIASAQTVTITATSAADTTKSATAAITLKPVAMTISPANVTVSPGQTVTFTAAVTGSGNTAVSWSMTPQLGTLANGVYTAPSTITAAQTVTISATSASRIASASLNLITTSTRNAGSSALLFVPVTPCRIADTRNAAGPFGGPALSGGTSRNFAIATAACGIPANAAAYSLNLTVVPSGPLTYVTLWPTGQTQPTVSTLNSLDSRVKANAAIVPAGSNGSISVFATDTTDVVLDIDGYFVPAGAPSALAFYPLPECRIADTRNPSGLAGPRLAAGVSRSISVLSSSCSIPSAAQAYSLNVTAIPEAGLGYLTVSPTGQARPLASTLNSYTGAITANAAIVPAGAGGAIDAYATDNTDLVIDINGYFAPPAAGGLALYAAAPCRVTDTRLPAGSPPPNGTFAVNVSASACSVPSTARAFVLNATAVPAPSLTYLTLWPGGQSQPLVSTLNAVDGALTSNMAIVPTQNGSINAFLSDPGHLILDLSAYFAPVP